MRFAPVALVALLLAPRAAAADSWRSWRWAVSIDMSARWASNLADDDRPDDLHQGVAAVNVRAMASKLPIQYAAGVDFELGFEVPGAFVYGLHVMPLGVGVRPFGRSYLGVVTGVGFGGVAERVPIAWEFPVEAFVELDLGGHVRLLAIGRATFTAGSDARSGGSATLGFADEAEATFGLAIGKRHREYGASWSDGTFVGLFAREQLGERILGITLSLAMNGASN